jgi:hypothetical protein
MRRGGKEKCKLLLESGAEPDGKSLKGWSARECTRMDGLGEYVDMIQEAKPAARRSMRIAQKRRREDEQYMRPIGSWRRVSVGGHVRMWDQELLS